jgi:hypothetical protein
LGGTIHASKKQTNSIESKHNVEKKERKREEKEEKEEEEKQVKRIKTVEENTSDEEEEEEDILDEELPPIILPTTHEIKLKEHQKVNTNFEYEYIISFKILDNFFHFS